MVNKNQYGSDAYLEQLSTEQLEDILRADLASEDQENDEAVFHILEVLEKREKENPTGRLPDTDQAWKEFQQYYNIPEGEGQSLYPVRSDPERHSAPTPTKKSRRFRPRKILVVAAVLVLMFGSMLTAQAAGVDVFGAIGRWTEEKFHFEFSTHETKDNQTTIAGSKVPEYLLPTWIPSGFKTTGPQVDMVEDYIDSISYLYENEENNETLIVDVEYYYHADDIQTIVFEKDDGEVSSYQSNGRQFYIMSNLDALTATWTDGVFVETISGQLSIDEIKQIIDSIGE